MYSLEDRTKAVELYFKYGGASAAVRRELGYPSKRTLKLWVGEYKTTGALHEKYCGVRRSKYSKEQKQLAVDYYLEHGRSLRRSIDVLGYPNRETLRQWLDEAIPDRQGLRGRRSLDPKVELTCEHKEEAVLDLCCSEDPAKEVAAKYGVSRAALYKWKNDLLGKESMLKRRKRMEPTLIDDKNALMAKVEELKQQVDALEKQIYRLQLERDVMEVTAEIIKKGPGADPKKLTNREKAAAIGALRKRYPLNEMLECFAIPKSSYFYNKTVMSMPDRYAELHERVRAAFTATDGRYGYRRVHALLTREGGTVSEKVVRRLMRDQDHHPIVHSDRGGHYRWPGWIERMEAAGLRRSMSKKGCSPDNAACEGFFGRLKNEFFYGRSWAGVSIEEFIRRLDHYLRWYNQERIKMSLGGRSPMEYRRGLKCA